MARGQEFPIGFVAFAVKSGMTAREGLAAYRAAGGSVRDATWYRMVGEVRAQINTRGSVITAPLDRKPFPQEITTWSDVTKTGFLQETRVIVRDRDTGEVIALPHSTFGLNLITHGEAIQQALDHFDPEGTDGERQQILGALYVGTLRLQPKEG